MTIRLAFPAGLRNRILFLILASVLPSLVLMGAYGWREYQLARQALDRQAESLAYQMGMFANEVIPDPEHFLKQLAAVSEVNADSATCGRFLALTLKSSWYLMNIFTADADGTITCSAVPIPPALKLSQQPYFRQALQTRDFSLSGYQLDSSGVPVMIFALPLLDAAGTIQKVVGLSIKLQWFSDSFARALASDARFAGMAALAIDEAGVVIAVSPQAGVVGQVLPEWASCKNRIQAEGRLVQNETWADGISRATAYLPLYSSTERNLYLRVGVPMNDSIWVVQKNNLISFFIFICALALIMLGASSLGQWLLVKPLHRLASAAESIGKGDLDVRSGLAQEDSEIGHLSGHFDRMAAQLQVQRASLLRIARMQAMRSATDRAMLGASSVPLLLEEICRIIRDIGGYRLAWIGYPDEDRVLVKAADGIDSEELQTILDEGGELASPVVAAIRTRTVSTYWSAGDKPGDAASSTRIASLGCVSGVGIPVGDEGGLAAGLGIYSDDADAFSPEEIQLLMHTANDLALGIASLRRQNELRNSQEFLRLIIDNIPSMVFVKDASTLSFVSINIAGENLIGYSERDLIGKTDHQIFSQVQADEFVSQDRLALSGEKKVLISNEELTTRSGDVITLQTQKLRLLDASGQPQYLLGISEDITERVKLGKKMEYLASYDELTALPNRRLLMERLALVWQKAEASGDKLAVMFVDLDGFKEINDTLGHAIGDESLKVVARLLQSCFCADDMLARVGGDEFVALLPTVGTAEKLAMVAELIKQQFVAPLLVNGHEIYLSASLGISVYPGDADDHETLLRNADIAMYQAKAQGRNTHSYYSSDMQTRATDRLFMRNLLRHAIERGEFVVHYQPKISVKTGAIVGAEALLRWNSKELGSVSPAEFIPLAEESGGLIIAIGEWVLRTACAQAKAWQLPGRAPFVMAVNVSAKQFRGHELLDTITRALDDTGLDAALLELEVTESVFMDPESGAIATLNRIAALGVRLAIDDFGTGYSSLSYLKRLPLAVLKIDQSFVRGLTVDENDAAIVTAILAMAQSLQLQVTAEGVETLTQLAILKRLGCHEFQGYLHSPALPASEFIAMLNQQR